jgi:hypothetical protein
VVTVLSETGAPTPVAWARMRAPRSLMAQIDATAQRQAVTDSALQAKYGTSIDRESAYEKLTAKLAAPQGEPAGAQRLPKQPGARKAAKKSPAPRPAPAPAKDSALQSILKNPQFQRFAKSAGTALAKQIERGVFGTRKR